MRSVQAGSIGIALAGILAVSTAVRALGDNIVMYSLGNSLTAPLYHPMSRLESLTHGDAPRVLDMYRQTRGSTAISTFLTHPSAPGLDFADPLGTYDVAFANNRFDVVTLQPFYGPTIRQEAAAAAQIVQMLRANPENANTRVMILATWPSRVDGLTYEQQWNATGQSLESSFAPSARAFELFMNELRLTVPSAELIPAGHVFSAIDGSGGLPGISGAADFYADSIHPNNAGAYIECLTTYSVIYGKSPLGLPYTAGFSDPLWGALLDLTAVEPAQTITWQVTQPFIAVPEASSAAQAAVVALLAGIWCRRDGRRRGSHVNLATEAVE